MTKDPKSAKKKVTQSKNQKLRDNLKKVIQQLILSKKYKPLTEAQIAEKLSITPANFSIFQEVLQEVNKSSLQSAPKSEVVKGIIHMHARGFGFVEVEGLLAGDIFIPKPFTNHAVDGDQVEVAVSALSTSDKGPEGKVLSIISRSRTHLAGIVTYVSRKSATVHVPLLGEEQPVLLDLQPEELIIIGDRVSMKVIEWGSQHESTRCILSRKIGHIDDPKTDIPAAIEEFEIRSEFPMAAIHEAELLGHSVPAKEIKQREDLRHLETFTIDPDTAKDFDDALTLSKDDQGIYHLGVHIADVSHYVRPGTPLDLEAFLRSNSTYFPGTCVPMLPSVLSDNLCSLKADVNRLTVSVFMDFNALGEMISHRISRTVIRSNKRFTYKEAKKVLDGNMKSPHAPTLHLMDELCKVLKKQRYERGSVEFAMPELVVLVDTDGNPTGTDYVEYDITHQLVEEFMLKANETVALYLDKQGKGLPFRVHDVPSEENMRDFAILAQAFGFKIANKPTAKDIQKLFDEALETAHGQYLATSYIRRMRLAIYSPINIGHFGLALTHYCHFTSPIRRYVDLVSHRLIFESAADPKVLQKITDKCSEQERISAKAEGSVLLLKKYRLLLQYHKEDPDKPYSVIITKIKPFGIFFEVIDLMIEGFIHISEIGDEYYQFDAAKSRLYGESSGENFASGTKIQVKLDDLNLITCESKWSRVLPSKKKLKRKFNR
jgi:ribonuclease R